ncbi:hypothetical protein DY000_02019269 [Brassica cretica]|uniref:Uncharacterized protein n=1 Tax=Brassica cretica TaxID=69181 RepID=A0ABQ7D7R4_BRACR|nr:hypothetical protein DY000_02019269 [Brassica cretica]
MFRTTLCASRAVIPDLTNYQKSGIKRVLFVIFGGSPVPEGGGFDSSVTTGFVSESSSSIAFSGFVSLAPGFYYFSSRSMSLHFKASLPLDLSSETAAWIRDLDVLDRWMLSDEGSRVVKVAQSRSGGV